MNNLKDGEMISFIIFIAFALSFFSWCISKKSHAKLEKQGRHIKLSQSKWFVRAFAIPLIFSCSVALIIVISEWNINKFCYTGKCFSNLYEIYRFPVWLAGLSLALSGIVAAAHRSDETAKQIELTENKNNFENNIKHKDKFIEMLTSETGYVLAKNIRFMWTDLDTGDCTIKNINDKKIPVSYEVNYNSIYSFLFPNNKNAGNTEFSLLEDRINKIAKALIEYLNNKKEEPELINFKYAVSFRYKLENNIFEVLSENYNNVNENIWVDDLEVEVELLMKIFNRINFEYGDSRRIDIAMGGNSYSFI